MSKQQHDPFVPIPPEDLSTVEGGAARVAAASSSTDDQMLMLMTQIGDAITNLGQNLASNQNNGLTQMLPLLMMLLNNNNNQQPPIVLGGGGGGCGGIGW